MSIFFGGVTKGEDGKLCGPSEDDPCSCEGGPKCVYGEWAPPPSEVCKGKTYTQRRELIEEGSDEECDEIDYEGPIEEGTGEPEWDCTPWEPSESEYCETELIDQTRYCVDVADILERCEPNTESRKVNGTKDCDDPDCVYSEWQPPTENYCDIEQFTQTRFVLSGPLEICDDIEKQTMGTKDCGCQYGDWEPKENTVCDGVPFKQTAERVAGEELCPPYISRDWVGTKYCNPSCVYSDWRPAEDTVCEGQSFRQFRSVVSGLVGECNDTTRMWVGTKDCVTCADFNLNSAPDCPEGQLSEMVYVEGLTCYRCYDDPNACISGSNVENKGTAGKNPEDPCNDFLTVLTLPATYTGMYSCTGTGDDQAEVNGVLFPASQPEIGPCYGQASFTTEVFLNAGDFVTCRGGSWGGRVGCNITCCLVSAP